MNRMLLLSIIALGAAAPARAASPVDEAIDRALACRGVSGDAARLACFDAAVAGVENAKALRAAEAAAKKAAKEQKKKEDFGLKGANVVVMADTEENFGGEAVPEIRAAQEERRLKSITAVATTININSLKQATLTLDNGQIWKQLESDDQTLPRTSDGKSYGVTIKRSAMGNYMAVIEDLHRSIRVTRVK